MRGRTRSAGCAPSALLLAAVVSALGCSSDARPALGFFTHDAATAAGGGGSGDATVPPMGQFRVTGTLPGYDLQFRDVIIGTGSTQPDTGQLSYLVLFSTTLTSCAGGGAFSTGMKWTFSSSAGVALTPGTYRPTSDSGVSKTQHGIDLEVVLAKLDANCSGVGLYADAGSSVTLDTVTDSSVSGSYQSSLPADGGLATFSGTFAAARCSGYHYTGCR